MLQHNMQEHNVTVDMIDYFLFFTEKSLLDVTNVVFFCTALDPDIACIGKYLALLII